LLNLLSEVYKKLLERPIVKTKFGFSVDGGEQDLKNLEMGKKHLIPYIIDIHGQKHDIKVNDYDDIISSIEIKRLKYMKTKWEIKQKILEIETVEEAENILNEIMNR
jgi:inorganic pyrophosphatase/exopolyphosphatase